VLKREDEDVDIRKDNPFVDFFRCRGVNRTWRDCADSVIRNLGKSPQVQLSRKHKECLFRDEYFAQFAPKLLKKDEWDDPDALYMDRSLTPHYRDYLVRTLALRSPNVTFSRAIKMDPGEVIQNAAVSTQFVILAKKASGQPVTLAIYSLSDVDCVSYCDLSQLYGETERITKLDIVSGVDGKEYVLLGRIAFAELIASSRPVIHKINYRPSLLPTIPGDGQNQVASPIFLDNWRDAHYVIFFEDKQVTDVRFREPKGQGQNLIGRWPSYKKLKYICIRNGFYDAWVFETVPCPVIIVPGNMIDEDLRWVCPDEAEARRRAKSGKLRITANKPGFQSSKKSFHEASVFQGGYVTVARLESHVLFLGTDNGLMHAYILGKDGISKLDMAKPDFSYRHELGEPVQSISIARCNRETGMVRILVCHEDRVQVIEKMPSADLSQ